MNRFRGYVREPSWFKIAAENYLLSGNLSEACDHNARIASDFGNYVVRRYLHFYKYTIDNTIISMYLIIILIIQVSKAWQVLKIMYTDPFEILQKSAPTAPKEDVANTSNIVPGVTKSSGMEQSNASKQSSKYKRE